MTPIPSIELLPGETCPCCGHKRPDSTTWNYGNGEHSYVPVERVRFVFIEISHRIGNAEGARRIGTGRHNFHKIVNNKDKKFVEQRTARAAILLLRELRENNVVISKASIRRGALARGETPKRPKQKGEFYKDPGEKEKERIRGALRRQRAEEQRLQQLAGY